MLLKMARIDYEAEIDKIIQQAQNNIQELADKFRVEVLIPFCRRKKFTYMAGNGMTVFYNQKGESINFWDKRLKPVQEIIDLGIFGSNDCLGYYVSDVTKEDIK